MSSLPINSSLRWDPPSLIIWKLGDTQFPLPHLGSRKPELFFWPIYYPMRSHVPKHPLANDKSLSQFVIFEENLLNNFLTLGTIKGLLSMYTVG